MPSDSPTLRQFNRKTAILKAKKLALRYKTVNNASMKALFIIIASLFLISCASSDSEVKHTIVIKGVNDGNTPNYFAIKVYGLYAGSDCSHLKEYHRFGKSGELFEFFKNTGAVIASARPSGSEVFGCVAIEISPKFSVKCTTNENVKPHSVIGNFTGATDHEGNSTIGPDNQPRVALFLTPTTPLDTRDPRDFYLVANGITDCVTIAAANFNLSETNP